MPSCWVFFLLTALVRKKVGHGGAMITTAESFALWNLSLILTAHNLTNKVLSHASSHKREDLHAVSEVLNRILNLLVTATMERLSGWHQCCRAECRALFMTSDA